MRFWDWQRKTTRVYLVLCGLGFLALSAYIVVAGLPDDRKLLLVLALVPALFGAMSLRQAPRLLLASLTVGLSFSARYRPGGAWFHQGGAELAIAPLDFPLLGLLILASFEAGGVLRDARALLRPIRWALLAFGAVHLLSIAVAADRALAALELLRLFKMILLVAILGWYLRSKDDLLFVLRVLLLAAIAQGTLAIGQWLFKSSFGLGFLGEHDFWEIKVGETTIGRSGGTLGHANVLAYFLELTTPLAAAYALARAPRRFGFIAPLAVAAGLAGTFLTFSRAGWAALGFGLLIVLAFQLVRRRTSFARLLPVLVIVVLVAVVAGLLAGDLVAVRLQQSGGPSWLFRQDTLRTALNMWRSSPLLGVGANNYTLLSPKYIPSDLNETRARNAQGVVHNILLLYGAELGVLGLGALLAFLASVLALALKDTVLPDRDLALAGVGLFAGLTGMLAHAQLDWLLRYDPVFTLLWFAIGLLLIMRRHVSPRPRPASLCIAMLGTRGIPASYSGFETCVEELGARLVQRGHRVIVYCRSHHIKLRERYYKGMELIRLPTIPSKHLDTIVHTFLSTLHLSFRRCDVALMFIVGNSLVSFIPRLTGKKVILNVDGLDWKRAKWGPLARRYIQFAEYLATKWPHAIVTDSRSIERYYLEKYGAQSAYITYGAEVVAAPPGEYLQRFGLEPRRYVLFVGRLVPENCVHHLVQAFAGLDTDFKCVIVGDAPYAQEYIASLKRNAGPNVIFTGYLFGTGYRELASNAYLFVETSEVGGTHPALLEAMAFGNCVVVNGTPENLETIGEAGFAYDGERGAEALREVLRRLLDDEETVRAYRERAAARVREHYSWERVTDAYEALCYEVLAGSD